MTGDDTSSQPIATRRRWPPLTPLWYQVPTTVLAQSERPSSSMTPSATACGVAPPPPAPARSRSRAAYRIVSRTVSVPSMTSSWVTNALRPYDSRSLWPFTRTSPSSFAEPASRPATASSSVDLPQPDGPTRTEGARRGGDRSWHAYERLEGDVAAATH